MGVDELLQQTGGELLPNAHEKTRLKARLSEVPPPHRHSTRVWWLVPAVAVAAIAVGVVVNPTPNQTRNIGGTVEPFPDGTQAMPVHPVVPDGLAVSLRLAVLGTEGANRVETGDQLEVGESVIFRVSANQNTPLTVWVDAPDGQTALAEVDLQATEPLDLPWEEGLLQWTFDSPGLHVFVAVPQGQNCEIAPCATVIVEVQ